uniref:Uncharacterized protein n=1 Tax=Oryza glaberrima TaxID=4538 RepID=I1P654_ORYGL
SNYHPGLTKDRCQVNMAQGKQRKEAGRERRGSLSGADEGQRRRELGGGAPAMTGEYGGMVEHLLDLAKGTEGLGREEEP